MKKSSKFLFLTCYLLILIFRYPDLFYVGVHQGTDSFQNISVSNSINDNGFDTRFRHVLSYIGPSLDIPIFLPLSKLDRFGLLVNTVNWFWKIGTVNYTLHNKKNVLTENTLVVVWYLIVKPQTPYVRVFDTKQAY